MNTSKRHALLFCKPDCGPCTQTKEFRDDLFTEHPKLKELLTTFEVKEDSIWRETYTLNKFPTLLIVDGSGEEKDRIVGGKKIREYASATLPTLLEGK